jgi:hypothetical protein
MHGGEKMEEETGKSSPRSILSYKKKKKNHEAKFGGSE